MLLQAHSAKQQFADVYTQAQNVHKQVWTVYLMFALRQNITNAT